MQLDIKIYDGEVVPVGSVLGVSFGGDLVYIQLEQIINPEPHLKRVRVSGKIQSGLYELAPKANAAVRVNPRYRLKKTDLMMIAPVFQNLLGAVKEELTGNIILDKQRQLREHKGLENAHILIMAFVKTDEKVDVKFARVV